ncbi:MAG: DUF1844 domain-containing protein [Betaproteobacteria bacterium]|nr:DUF1844 domain-containing protein [Betaproteobacteria bacterium]
MLSEHIGTKPRSTHVEHSSSLFSLLALSLGNAALVGLGLVPEPDTGATAKNLELAAQNIELLSMLKEKTKGNLSPEEQHLLDGLLYDLRLKYVDGQKKP